MLNFKKAGIFSRGSGQEDACEQEDQSGGVLAVWGSPGSGKTTVAVRLAKYLAGNLLADLSMKDSRVFRKEIEKIAREVFGC